MVVQLYENEEMSALLPMSVRISFAMMLILTTVAGAVSVGLVACSVHEFASQDARFSDLALLVTCIAACWCVAKPCLAIMAAHSRLSKAGRCGAGAVWLILVAFSWAFVSVSVVPWRDGINAIDLWFAASILLLEIISGAMPAVLYAYTVEADRNVSSAAKTAPGNDAGSASSGPPVASDSDCDEDEDLPPPLRRMQSPPRFSSISDLLRDLEVHGPERFPMLLFEAGRLSASQRNITRALGCESPSTANAWLKKEKARGLIDFKVSTRLTTVWLVSGPSPPIAVRASAHGGMTLGLDFRAG